MANRHNARTQDQGAAADYPSSRNTFLDLAEATVGIAMGAVGSDVALETADVVLMADDLEKLAYPTRAKIVFALSQAELCVCDIAALVDLSVSAVSHQLRVLRNLGLVTYRKEGRLAYYTLTDEHIGQFLQDVLVLSQA